MVPQEYLNEPLENPNIVELNLAHLLRHLQILNQLGKLRANYIFLTLADVLLKVSAHHPVDICHVLVCYNSFSFFDN